MTTTKLGQDPPDVGTATNDHDAIALLEKALEAWRRRLDDLVVQIDLASMDVRDELHKQAHAAENAYLAAKSQIAVARHEMGSDLTSARHGIEHLLHDLQRAFDDADRAAKAARQH